MTNDRIQSRKFDVTILIRAKNEARLIGECLEAVFGQRTQHSFEVLLIDSGSADGTVEIAQRHPVRVECIPPQSFNYGAALNLGTRLARGQFVVALSAHCVPVNEVWLDELVRPLLDDEQVAGSFGRQVPWPDCDLHERALLDRTFGGEPYVVRATFGEDPLAVVFSNASSCYRRDLACQHPFEELPWAEDRVWAYQMLCEGYAIAYSPTSSVFHSHKRTLTQAYRVGRADGRTRGALGLPVTPLKCRPWWGARNLYRRHRAWRNTAKAAGIQGAAVWVSASSALALEIAQGVGTWRGGQDATTGAPAAPKPAAPITRCSTSKS